MQTYRYRLQPYDGRHTRFHCPQCNNRFATFTRYIDMRTGQHIHPTVGICSRLDKCAYHLNPAAYFKLNPRPADRKKRANNINKINIIKHKPLVSHGPNKPKYISSTTLRQSLKGYSNNYIINYLIKMFGSRAAEKLAARYYIGTANHWPGATVFWQIDTKGNIRTGKIMLYNADTGKRVKEPYNHVTWAHTLLSGSSSQKVQPNTATASATAARLKQCLFGEHLLNTNPTATVALVESEKTALIASIFMPQYLWMATGSLSNFNTAMCRPLKGRRVILYPDLNAYDKWKHKADIINKYIIDIDFTVDGRIEDCATDEERQQGLDIADYLMRWRW